MNFAELIALFAEQGEERPEDFLDQLNGAHTSAFDGAAAKIASLEETIASLSSELATTKSHNYDLMMSVNVDSDESDSDESDSESDEDDSDSDPLDDLFEDKD